MITGTADFQQMFQNELYEVVQVPGDDRNFIMPIVRLSNDSIFKDTSSITILNNGRVSTGNSTSTPLGAGETFTGSQEDVSEYAHIIITVHTDAPSANLGLEAQFFISDAWHASDSYTIESNKFKTYSIQPVSSIFRIVYTNGDQPQVSFHVETQFKKGVGVVSSHRIGDPVTLDDDAQMVQTVIKAKKPNGSIDNVNATQDGTLNVGINHIQADAAGRVRVSQFTTLGDYKSALYERDLLFDNQGTGSGTWSNGIYEMSVQSGQYRIKESHRTHHYFSGKSQAIEFTFDNFSPQTGTVKRIGYFSTKPTGTYTEQRDGTWLESNGQSGTIYLKTANNGSETISVPMEQWSGFNDLEAYTGTATWDNFTVAYVDFLWLGGATERLWVKNKWGFVLAHEYKNEGTVQGTFMKSPSQPFRAEIHSFGGSGNFRYVCAQVATEGSISESGLSRSVSTGLSPLTLSSSTTTYAVKGIRLAPGYRNLPVKIDDISILIGSSDIVLWSLQINPTLSSALTWSSIPGTPGVQQAQSNTITVTSPGTIIASGYMTQDLSAPANALKDNYLAWLGAALDGTPQEYILCFGNQTSNVSANASISFKEY